MKAWLSYDSDSEQKSYSLVNAVVQSLRDFSWTMSRIALRLMSAGEQVTEKQLSNFKKEGALHFRTFNRLVESLPQKIATAFVIHLLANLNLLESFFSQFDDLRSQKPRLWKEADLAPRVLLAPSRRYFAASSEGSMIFNSSSLRLWLWAHFQISQANENRITDIDLNASRVEIDGISYCIPGQCYGKVLREPDPGTSAPSRSLEYLEPQRSNLAWVRFHNPNVRKGFR